MKSTFTLQRKRLHGFILCALLTSLVAGCGGGGGGASVPAPTPVVPPVVVPVVPPVVVPVVPPATPAATVITLQPQSQSVTLAAVASFSVETSGPAPLGYQWLRNGTPIEGATARIYAPPAAQPLDNGAVFRVIVHTSEGHIESAPAAITVPGAGLRLVAGGFEKDRTFNPLFDTRLDMSAIATDAAGNVYASKGDNLSRLSTDGTWTALGVETCHPSAGIAVDKAGTMYFACDYAILKRTAAGVVTSFTGVRHTAGNVDGDATAARFSTISALTIGLDGLIYVADIGNGIIRRVANDGAVTTLAGGPRNGIAVDGAGAAAKFREMSGLVADLQGNVYVTDRASVRKVTATGVVTTFAGNPSQTAPGWTDGIGAVARFGQPFGIAIDAKQQLYVADAYYHNIRKLTPNGVVATLAGSHEQFGSSDGFGRFASFHAPRWLAIDASGNVVVSEYGNGTFRKVTPAGVVTTLAGVPGLERSSGGLNGLGQEARLRTPKGLSIESNGNLLVADSLGHSVRRITPAGEVSTVAGSVLVYGTTDGSGALASFRMPARVASAGNGVVYVLDSLDDSATDMIRRIGADGAVTTVQVPRDPLSVTAAGVEVAETNRFLSADLNGNYYVATSAAGATGGRWKLRRIAPSGAAATILSGDMAYPGTGKTIDSSFSEFRNMAVDRNGVVYLVDSMNNTVLKVTTSGAVSLFAGTFGEQGSIDGPAAQARFSFPAAIAVDGADNVYVVDASGSTVRKVSPSGAVSTLAGTPLQYREPTGALPGTLRAIKGIAVDANGAVFITQENAIVKIVQPGP